MVSSFMRGVSKASVKSGLGSSSKDAEGTMGYKQELVRGMDSFMSFSIGFTEVSAVVSITSILGYGLTTGGPLMITWGWLITFVMTIFIAINFAELCSVFPLAGSVYHWSGVLAPRKFCLVAAYWTGLFNWLGNTAGDSSFAFIFAQFVSAAIVTAGGDPLSTPQLVAIAICVLFAWSIINCYHIDKICWVNNLASLVQLATIASLAIMVLLTAPMLNGANYAFFTYNNETGFTDDAYVIILSFLFPLFGFAGYDGPAHLAEETRGSKVAAPWGIIYTVIAIGLSGFLLIMALMLSLQDIDDAIGGVSGNAAIQIVTQCAGQNVACIFSWMLVINIFFCGSSSVTVTTRILFALCRDKATVCADTLSYVHPTFHSPMNAVIFLFFIQCILLLIPLNSDQGTTAFYSIVGITVVGLQISYFIPIALKVLNYCYPANNVMIINEMKTSAIELGIWSVPIGIVSCLWLFFTTFILLLPTTDPITSQSMNFTCVAVGFVLVLGELNWELNSKHVFLGPPRSDDALAEMEKKAIKDEEENKDGSVHSLECEL